MIPKSRPFNKVTRKPLIACIFIALFISGLSLALLPRLADALSWNTPASIGSGWYNPVRHWLQNPNLRAHPVTGEAHAIGHNGSADSIWSGYDTMLLVKSDKPEQLYDVNTGPKGSYNGRLTFAPNGESYATWIAFIAGHGNSAFISKYNSNGSVNGTGRFLPATFGNVQGNDVDFINAPDLAYSNAKSTLYIVGHANIFDSAPKLLFTEYDYSSDSYKNSYIPDQEQQSLGKVNPKLCINKKNDNVHIVYSMNEKRKIVSRVNGVWQSPFDLGDYGPYSLTTIN